MGSTAIVTGAARGIGRSVVLRLRAAGYRVVAVDVSPAVTDLAEDGRVVPMVADVTLESSPAAVTGRAIAEFGRLDLLVNNAARFLRRPSWRPPTTISTRCSRSTSGLPSGSPAPPCRC